MMNMMIIEETYKWRKITWLIIFSLILIVTGNKKNNSIIYMLMWTYPDVEPFTLLEMGQQYFINKNCRFQNCFFTNDRSYFRDILDFDVVLYDSTNIRESTKPLARSENQRYVFLSYEPPSICPMPPNYEGFFNLTWTYRLDSDVTLKYLVVRNKRGNIVAPKKYVKWIDEKKMKPISKYIKRKLKNKKKPAAWFVSNCFVASQRQCYIEELKTEINTKYNLPVDVFGRCSYMQCPKDSIDECYALLESDYYFYLAFENSLCEDYVTEKVLTALKHFAVPVVYGGANYKRYPGASCPEGWQYFPFELLNLFFGGNNASLVVATAHPLEVFRSNKLRRFLPTGSYLNAYGVEPVDLARIINDTIHDVNKYYNYFKWHRYYTVHEPSESADSDEICGFCAFLNDKEEMRKTTIYTNITNFWSY